MAKLEGVVGQIESSLRDLRAEFRDLRAAQERDFRITFGALIAVAVGLAGLMAKGFHWF